jgi:hypothetical protein
MSLIFVKTLDAKKKKLELLQSIGQSSSNKQAKGFHQVTKQLVFP